MKNSKKVPVRDVGIHSFESFQEDIFESPLSRSGWRQELRKYLQDIHGEERKHCQTLGEGLSCDD
ncbi:MAG: hypothetical protein COW12_01960 [Candidatus Omnitrophica bacterium CG12_big_fil_rev_8_21_14_0_65_45_16]|nr:MAG: hypothetical protein COW12_01960 [Candidatus Omnitrophica bacterium CG12_big_fil_rev_8_21_14_0_65_45_16]